MSCIRPMAPLGDRAIGSKALSVWITARTRSARTPYAEACRTMMSSKRPAAGRFEDIIVRHASAYGVRADLVRAVIQTESAFDPMARSPKGAMGLMQLMPDTAADYGVADPYDPEQNVRGGVAYLKNLLDRYDGSEELA